MQNHLEALPTMCYIKSAYTGYAMRIVQGLPDLYGVHGRTPDAVELNKKLGITKAQYAAMVGGYKYGWDSPQSDLSNYASNGKYIGPAGY